MNLKILNLFLENPVPVKMKDKQLISDDTNRTF